MDTAPHHRNLADPAWRRWLLLLALLALGVFYVAAYSVFAVHSKDFIAARYNQRAREFSSAHVVPVPAKLSFGAGEPDNARLGGGWHLPDSGGVWSQSVDTFVEISVPRQHPALLLRLDTTVYVPKQRRQVKIKAIVNGVPAGKWKRDSSNASQPLDLYVPAALSRTGQLTIHLKLDHLASPFRLGDGPDTRELGFLLRSIEVRDVQDQVAAAATPH